MKNPNKTLAFTPAVDSDFAPGPQLGFIQGGAKLHIFFPYNLNILSKCPAYDHIKISVDFEQNYSDNWASN